MSVSRANIWFGLFLLDSDNNFGGLGASRNSRCFVFHNAVIRLHDFVC